ncbi:PfkB family carbohydrate kinase [Jatrophihabitans sp.]|uniref:PfkB family carbohydrate kinase n=1 Tax=Jatrophihabitans sp. TaxID=1932789 RepID=UPI002CA6D78B|nr:PfkB family carbohydrate kinase [Jatrophihabitans sp.]
MAEPDFDVIMQGTVFFDVVLTGLPALPTQGTELMAEGMGSCPGGIANLAVAASRLGLRTALAAVFGDDVYGDFLWRTLAEQEGVDLSRSQRLADWHSPVTVSLAVQRDRAMVTHSHPAPIPPSTLLADPPSAAAGVVHLGAEPETWVSTARRRGMLLFGDVGWDPSQQWSTDVLQQLSELHAFLPNSTEAMAYTRTDDPRAALIKLADSVPVVVVTCGGQGSIAIDSISGEDEWVPSLPVNAVDATGAGDVFAAAFVLGTLRDWPLRNRLAFANLCAALSVQQVGGSLAAPGWGDIADWLADVRGQAAAGSRSAGVLAHSYEFLAGCIPAGPAPTVRRARATIARTSDA